MTPLDLPGLIVIAGRTLGLDTPELFGLLDLPAAERAIAEAELTPRPAAATWRRAPPRCSARCSGITPGTAAMTRSRWPR